MFGASVVYMYMYLSTCRSRARGARVQDHGELERPPLTTVVALRPASATR